ncbi:MAG TPA: hypothetical protein VFQ53_13020 [Kofleriaceae bacterium]|nr:hypothetical protein [Kofleriaceae bacterium]
MLISVRIWQSFSCNNSASYRLVARFADAKTAAAVAKDLEPFFEQHAQEMDALMADGDFPRENPATAQALAKQYGFQWKTVMSWGDEMMEGDEPEVMVSDDVVVVYHGYCGGGLGKGMLDYLKKRGATKITDGREPFTVSVLFDRQPGNKKLEKELDAIAAQLADNPERYVEPFQTPWKGRDAYGQLSMVRDAKTVGIHFPIRTHDLPAFQAWLAKHGVKKPAIRLCEDADDAKFALVAGARCLACAAPLEYLDPRLHDIETEQLACRACGGLYELPSYAKAMKKQQAAAERAAAKAAAAVPQKPAAKQRAAKKRAAKKPAAKPRKRTR